MRTIDSMALYVKIKRMKLNLYLYVTLHMSVHMYACVHTNQIATPMSLYTYFMSLNNYGTVLMPVPDVHIEGTSL